MTDERGLCPRPGARHLARGGLVPAGALAYALDGKNLSTISVESSTGVDARLDVAVILPP